MLAEFQIIQKQTSKDRFLREYFKISFTANSMSS